jgi:hypothetical protein
MDNHILIMSTKIDHVYQNHFKNDYLSNGSVRSMQGMQEIYNTMQSGEI